MSAALPSPTNCNEDCTSIQTVNVPGTPGSSGSSGVDGSNGVSAFTVTTAAFTVPAELANVTISVANSTWAVVGEVIYIQGAGYYQVMVVPSNVSLTIKNLEDAATSAYSINAAPTTVIGTNAEVTPSGVQGPSGALTGTAGNDLEGTYPNPRLKITMTKGDIIVNNNNAVNPRNTRLGVGADGTIIHASSAAATGLAYRAVDLAGVNTQISGATPITNGGTGQTTKAPAFLALSPLTTRGDIIVRDATTGIRLAVGAANTVLTSDGTDPAWAGVTAAMMATSAKYHGRYGLLGSLISANANSTADQAIAISSTKYIIRKIVAVNASTDLSVATIPLGGLYTNAAKAGTIIVAAAQSYTTLTAAAKFLDLTLTAVIGTDVLTASTIYLSLSTAHGSAATFDLYVIGDDLS